MTICPVSPFCCRFETCLSMYDCLRVPPSYRLFHSRALSRLIAWIFFQRSRRRHRVLFCWRVFIACFTVSFVVTRFPFLQLQQLLLAFHRSRPHLLLPKTKSKARRPAAGPSSHFNSMTSACLCEFLCQANASQRHTFSNVTINTRAFHS